MLKPVHGRMFIKKILLLACFMPILWMFASAANAAIWVDENSWDDEWEERYREWVNQYWTEEFFMNPEQPLYNKVEHDCADAGYLMRMVFSYENRLPFIIRNVHKGGFISNKMKKWDRLPQEKRMRKFMDYVADMTSTQTLKLDTYPVALNDIKPGDVYVAPGVHSYQIVNITDTGIAEVMASTTPKAARPLSRYKSFPFYVPEDKHKRDGYRRFISPANIKKSIKKQPGYSEEQFDVADSVGQNYVKFTDVITKKLGTREEKPREKSLRLLTALTMYANDRGVYVYDAQWHLKEMRAKGRKCMNRSEYDSFSTPGRDKRLKQFFDAVRDHISVAFVKDRQSAPQRWAAAIFSENPDPRDLRELNKYFNVKLVLGMDYTMPLRELREKVDAGSLVGDPHAPIDYRWGIRTDPPYKPTCPTY